MMEVLWCAVRVALALIFLAALLDAETLEKKYRRRQPNFIIFLVDDLGYGDLSPYGHPTSQTPNIQRLAEEGVLFTQFYAASSEGSASRAALLTGRYQTRSGVYPGEFSPDDIGGLPLNETTIAESLKPLGYRTAMVGKWHLGVGKDGQYLPTRHGFDYYSGIPYSHSQCPCFNCFYPNQRCHQLCDPEYVPCPIFECTRYRQQIVQQPANLLTLSPYLLNNAVHFITSCAYKKAPFFLYYSFHHMHSPQFAGERFYNTSKRGVFGDALREVDYAVGLVMQALKSNGLDSSTFIFLTSDNGPDLSHGREGGCAGPLRCGKGSTWEGGVRVPAIAWWRGRIRHRRNLQLASHLDLFPTIMRMARGKIPIDRNMDGVDMCNSLFRQRKIRRQSVPYFPAHLSEIEGPYAIRWRDFKAHYYTRGGSCSQDYYDEACRYNTTAQHHSPPLLYNVNSDPGELHPLDTTQYTRVLKKIEMIRYRLLRGLEWRDSQTQKGSDKTVQPCGKPGCTPFPYCCKVNHLSVQGGVGEGEGEGEKEEEAALLLADEPPL